MNLRDRTSVVGLNTMTNTVDKPVVGGDFASLRVNAAEVVNFDKKVGSAAATSRSSFRNHEIYSRMSEAQAPLARQSMAKTLTAPSPVDNFRGSAGPKVPNISRKIDSIEEKDEDAEESDGPKERHIDPFDNEEDLEFDMTDLIPLICFLDGWLEAIKDKEWTYNYRKKRYSLLLFII